MIKDSAILQSAIRFTAKFGFLTQEIFFEYICQRCRAQKYVIWRDLQEKGYFVASKRNPKVLYFTKKGFTAGGPQCVKRRYFYYIEHDSVVAQILLNLESTGRVLRSWTEAELKAIPWETTSILGASDASKLPDLVVDLQGMDGFVRIAFEIEASRKSRERYDQIAFSYLSMKKINLVVFVCENESLQSQIDKSFTGNLFTAAGKSPVTLLIEDLERHWLDANSKYLGRRLSLKELLSKALKVEFKNQTNVPDKHQTTIWKEKTDKTKEAA